MMDMRVCKSSHIGLTVWNGAASCSERTCTQTGFVPNDCGENANCVPNSNGDGIVCRCNDGFVGSAMTNERATCVEDTCDGVDCGIGAFCQASTVGNGYECVCDAAYVTNVTQNGPVTCTERTCSNLGFANCGNDANCTKISLGVKCSCIGGSFVGLTVLNACLLYTSPSPRDGW